MLGDMVRRILVIRRSQLTAGGRPLPDTLATIGGFALLGG
jgi:hypothetical protein